MIFVRMGKEKVVFKKISDDDSLLKSWEKMINTRCTWGQPPQVECVSVRSDLANRYITSTRNVIQATGIRACLCVCVSQSCKHSDFVLLTPTTKTNRITTCYCSSHTQTMMHLCLDIYMCWREGKFLYSFLSTNTC